MTEFAHIGGTESNRAANICSVDFSWRDFFVVHFPDNTAAYVAFFTRTSVRAAEHVLTGRNGLSARAMLHLLRSPYGAALIDALAADADWRSAERRLLDIAAREQELELLKAKTREIGVVAKAATS